MKKKILNLLKNVMIILCFIFLFLFIFSINLILGILSLIAFFYLRLLIRFSLPSGGCYLWLGVPGSGKTTCAAWIAKHYKDSDFRVFSNVPIKGTYKYDWKHDFGRYDMSKSIIICDEAGICLNGRNWKDNFDKKSLEVIKKFRHYEMTLHFFSQANDEDPIIRNLSMVTYVVEKSLIPYFVRYRVIASRIDINEQTHKHDTCEFWKPLSKRLVFCPPAWKLFDTLECEKLPCRDWNMW
jgi:hypothetical protein